ncbi:hypothetical protein Hdeb2414_s0003g00104851 [Helianthus debilis subsp. tardiflorus]
MFDLIDDIMAEQPTHTPGATHTATPTEGTSTLETNDGIGLDPEFDELFKELYTELYPGCSWMSSLSGLAKLMHMKVINKWTDSSFDQFLEFLRVALPKENKIPASHYEAKKKMSRYSTRKNKLHDHFRAVGGDKDVDRAKSCPPKNYDSRKWVDLIDILFTDPNYIRRSNANTEKSKDTLVIMVVNLMLKGDT